MSTPTTPRNMTIDEVNAPTTPETTPVRVNPVDVNNVLHVINREAAERFNNNRPVKRPRFLQTVG
jgi:hypothetical protein